MRGRVPTQVPVVRRPTAEDVAACVALLVASITTLCAADHLNDPATLQRWLRNKTASDFAQWRADPENFIVVAQIGATLSGVALLHRSGTIRLCYVLPGMQRQGVGRMLMNEIESEARRRALLELRLMSTGNARRFYEQLGYVASGDASVAFGVLEQHPYAKALDDVAV